MPYSAAWGDYEHNEVRVVIERPETRDGNILVSTVVERTGTPPARVTWAISGDANNPRIVDVLAEGVSLRLTMRADYNAYLTRHGDSIVALIDALEGAGVRRVCDGYSARRAMSSTLANGVPCQHGALETAKPASASVSANLATGTASTWLPE